jgi:hypothetical protein
VSLRRDQLIPVNKAVNEKEQLEKGLEEEEEKKSAQGMSAPLKIKLNFTAQIFNGTVLYKCSVLGRSYLVLLFHQFCFTFHVLILLLLLDFYGRQSVADARINR